MIRKNIVVSERNMEIVKELGSALGLNDSEVIRRLIDSTVRRNGEIVLPKTDEQSTTSKLKTKNRKEI